MSDVGFCQTSPHGECSPIDEADIRYATLVMDVLCLGGEYDDDNDLIVTLKEDREKRVAIRYLTKGFKVINALLTWYQTHGNWVVPIRGKDQGTFPTALFKLVQDYLTDEKFFKDYWNQWGSKFLPHVGYHRLFWRELQSNGQEEVWVVLFDVSKASRLLAGALWKVFDDCDEYDRRLKNDKRSGRAKRRKITE